ncbi:unnamed protein product [Choristocarpus tenellus]
MKSCDLVCHGDPTLGAEGSQPLSTSSSDPPNQSDLCCREGNWEKETPKIVLNGERHNFCEETKVRGRCCSSKLRSLTTAFPDDPRQELIEVVSNMLKAERKFQPRVDEVTGDPLFNKLCPFVASRRKRFVAWKVQMAGFFGYRRDTVSVALNYFDRYTCSQKCSPTVTQAVAATAVHLAAKFEEPNPAPMHVMLEYAPAFTSDHLKVMELSLLKVLKWDLRPVTVYDFLHAFLLLLSNIRCKIFPTSISSIRAGHDENDGRHCYQCSCSKYEQGDGRVNTNSSPIDQENEDKKFNVGEAPVLVGPNKANLEEDGDSFKSKQFSELRNGVEEIVEMCRFESHFIQFPPSVQVLASLLLFISHNVSSGVSHDDVLQACHEIGINSLDCIFACLKLLGPALAERYPPTISSAAKAATIAAASGQEGRTTHPVEDDLGGSGVLPAADGVGHTATTGDGSSNGKVPIQVSSCSPQLAVGTKAHRCSTPTGVDGIHQIEMEEAGVSDSPLADNSNDLEDISRCHVVVDDKRVEGGGKEDLRTESSRVTSIQDQNHPSTGTFPGPHLDTIGDDTGISSRDGGEDSRGGIDTLASLSNFSATVRVRKPSFSFSDSDISKASTLALQKEQGGSCNNTGQETHLGSAIRDPSTSSAKIARGERPARSAFNPTSSQHSTSPGPNSSVGKKRSGVLGHCEIGSGFNTPAVKVQRTV